jgi:glutaconyl-CoA/methylmalonyl-CoA decarboxylase subunit gamma
MHYSIKIGDQTYSADIENLDARPIVVTVDGDRVEVWPEENIKPDQAVRIEEKSSPKPDETPCLPVPASQPGASARSVKAPIPGVIIEIKVTAGQSVNRGDVLCILEAMKMKNSIRAGRSGVIGSIQINVGDQVRHGQILMDFTE